MPVGNEVKKSVVQNSVAKQTNNNVKAETKSVETNKNANFYLNNNKNSNTKIQTMENRQLSKEDNDILSAISDAKDMANKNVSEKSISDFIRKNRITNTNDLTPEQIEQWKREIENNECDVSLKFSSLFSKGKEEGVPLETRIRNAIVGGDSEVKTSTKRENEDGTVTETIEYEDGTTSVKTINKDGSYTETGTCSDGETWEKTVNIDGSYTKTRMMEDGSVCKVIVNANGDVHAETTSPNGYTSTQDLHGNIYTEDVKKPDGSFHHMAVNTDTGRTLVTGGRAIGELFGGIVYEPYQYLINNIDGEAVS